MPIWMLVRAISTSEFGEGARESKIRVCFVPKVCAPWYEATFGVESRAFGTCTDHPGICWWHVDCGQQPAT